MPNWCDNYLQIDGSNADVAKFVDENSTKEGHLRFGMSCPVPEELGDWDYNWCRENWGTKWELEDELREDFNMFKLTEEDAICIFETAWGPPDAWLATVATKYPDLHFTLRYAEEGMQFSGLIECEEGDCKHISGDYGEFYGDYYCEACEEEQDWFENTHFHLWDKKLRICCECRDNAFETISKSVRGKKISELPKKLACKRMGRNPIVDNYMMRKVFIPRLSECVC